MLNTIRFIHSIHTGRLVLVAFFLKLNTRQFQYKKHKMDAQRREVVVVTGAAGFLGYHTIRLLSKDDTVKEVRCLDLREPVQSMKESIDKDLREYNNSNSNNTKKVKWIQGDIRDINLVERILDKADCVIHLAAKVDIWTEKSEQNVEELESVNVHGTENLLKASIRLGVYKFIHVSSFEIYTSLDTIYFATENTLPENRYYLFGASATSKKAAEERVKQYSNNKLQNLPFKDGICNRKRDYEDHREDMQPATGGCEGIINRGNRNPRDSLNAIIVRFPAIYGEYDKYYVSRILKVTKRYFNGKLRRLSNIWIKQQPIYVGNAAWSLIQAKKRMDYDHQISGEEFHITDETAICDSFDFLEPFLQSKGMRLSENSYPFLPLFLLLISLLWFRRLLALLDVFGLYTKKKGRLEEAIERDKRQQQPSASTSGQQPHQANREAQVSTSALTAKKSSKESSYVNNDDYDYDAWEPRRWYDAITPQILGFMAMSAFLNRTKASLRLNYSPLYSPEEAHKRSLEWYEKSLKI